MVNDKNIYAYKVTFTAIIIFTIASLFYCYAYCVQVIPSILSRNLLHEFSANMMQLGILSSSFYWLYTTMQLPAGIMLDRWGSRLMLTIATATCAFATLIFATTHNVQLATASRILMGASATFSFTGVIYLVIRWLPASTFAMFAGMLQMIASLGAIFGSSFLAKVLLHYPWRPAIIVLAIIGFVFALTLWLVVRNKPKEFHQKERQHYNTLKALKIVLSNPQTWYIAIYAIAIWGPTLAFAALWGIPFLKTSLNFSALHAANAIALMWIGIAIGSPWLGWLSDKVKRRCLPLTIVALLGFVAIILIIYIPHLTSYGLYVLLFLVGIASSGQTLSFGVVKDINHINTAGTANGFNNMAVVAGGILLQPFIGWLLDRNWDGITQYGQRIYNMNDYHWSLWILPICFLLAAIMSMFFIKETHCKHTFSDAENLATKTK